MSFYAELRRRKIFRVAVVYAATAFVVLQAADIMLPSLGVPAWAMPLIVTLCLLGFPIALVLGWALELTPDGIRRTDPAVPSEPAPALLGKRTIFAAALLVTLGVGLGAGWFLRPAGDAPTSPAPLPDPGAATGSPPDAPDADVGVVAAKSIAVLPFVNMSADTENEYFADGISEELLNVLVRVEDIGVASRTSSFAYKGREVSAVTIARELDVNHILEGSVRKSGNRVRITAQLIDAVNDRHLWSETYDRELDDIFAIQDEIANTIVAALRGTLGSGDIERAVTVHADTDNLDAYQLYLKARELFLARVQLDESIKLFERAVALDPRFARGWEGLAVVSAVIIDWTGSYPTVDRAARIAAAEHAAARALDLDPELSLPWAARSLVATTSSPPDFAAGLEMIDRALAADSRNASALLWRGIIWINLGFLERALADIDHCLVIEPAYGNCLRWKALSLLFQGEVAEALAAYEQGMTRGFGANRANSFVEPLVRRGNTFAAILLMREIRWPLEFQQAVIALLGDGKAPGDVAAMVRRYPELDRAPFQLALLLREYDLAAAMDALSGTTVEHWDPAYEGLRATPAFKRILGRLGVPDYWRAHGYPPQCRPVGADDFECVQ
jgi:TolB-like protein